MYPLEGRLRSLLAQLRLQQEERARSPCPPLPAKLRRAQVPAAHGIAPLQQCQSVAPPEVQALHRSMLHGLLNFLSSETTHNRFIPTDGMWLEVCKRTCQDFVVRVLSLHAVGGGPKDIHYGRCACLSGDCMSQALTARARRDQVLCDQACMRDHIVSCGASQSCSVICDVMRIQRC